MGLTCVMVADFLSGSHLLQYLTVADLVLGFTFAVIPNIFFCVNREIFLYPFCRLACLVV
jgi:hypothetical protein